MSVYKKAGRETYSYEFQSGGVRFSGGTGCTSRREAEKVEKAEREKARQFAAIDQDDLTFEAACARYWQEVGQNHKNQKDTLAALDWLCTHLGTKTRLANLASSDVARLVARRRAEGVTNATINRSVVEPLRAIHLRARDVWEHPVRGILWKSHTQREAPVRERSASTEEEAKIFQALPPAYRAIVLFNLLYALRRSEALNLEWRDIDLDMSKSEPDRRPRFSVTGKGGKTRTIPLTAAGVALLRALPRACQQVFTRPLRRGEPVPKAGNAALRVTPITQEALKSAWRRAVRNSGVKDFRFHDLRHTGATRILRETGDLAALQRLLGHSDIKTTMRYGHVLDEDLRAGLEAAHARNNQPGIGGR